MKTQPPKIASPCPKQWENMTGDAKCRFCDHCQLQVHNLSAMRPRERETFLAARSGKTCVTYLTGADGSLISEGFWQRLFKPLRFGGAMLLATLLPAWFASCRRSTTGSICTPPQRLTGEAPNAMVTAKPQQPEKEPVKPSRDKVP